jgi:uncharacterized protein
MEEQLFKLLDVQKLDIQIAKLDKEKGKITKELDDINTHYKQALVELEKGKEKVKKLKVGIKSVEIKLETHLERVKKLESQQSLVKTNQEYKALDKEILDTKANVALEEEEMLKRMEEIEGATNLTGEQESKAKQEQNLVAEKESEINSRISDIKLKIDDLKKVRDKKAESVEKRLLRVYNRIFKNKKFPALVPIVHQACQGCHIKVPPSVEAQARRREKIVTCENCARILYHQNETSEEEQS